jgi:hypothetical protein
MNNNNVKSVTADSSADLKLLRKLRRQGLITITFVNLENGKHYSVSDKLGPVGVYGKSEWDDGSVWGSEDSKYKQILSIVGGDNYQDARLLEAHSGSGNDIFVTGDNDHILSNKDALLKQVGITVMSSEELKSYVAKS